MIHNPGCDYDINLIKDVHINYKCIHDKANEIIEKNILKNEYRAGWLLKALTCIDLTTLSGDDTFSNVTRLCYKADKPLSEKLLEKLNFSYGENCPIKTAAVCIYPLNVEIAVETLKKIGVYGKINVASVATGFPSGQMPLTTRLDEIKFAVEKGANEIDIVINRSLAIAGKWEELYKEIRKMKEACGPNVHMKAILATGELGNFNNIYRASMVAMMAGADFIKTSTGKETVNATLPVGIVMARAINHFNEKYDVKVGLKPAGGIKTSDDALNWLLLVREILGNEWLNNKLFRFGASGLLTDIEMNLFEFAYGYKPKLFELQK